MSVLNADSAQSIEKLDSVTVHLPAERRIVCTPDAPDERPHAPSTLEAKSREIQGETHADV